MMETDSLLVVTDATELPAKVAVCFGADWDGPSQQLRQLLGELARTGAHPGLALAFADAEACDALCDRFGVEAVPTVVLVQNGTAKTKLEAPEADAVAAAVAAFHGDDDAGAEEAAEIAATRLDLRLKQLTTAAPCVLFMKGSPDAPRCGFSRQVCELLEDGSVPFTPFDILADDAVRHGLKKFSDWPTYPQLYANGELVGGLDILKEMAADGDLLGQLALEDEDEAEEDAAAAAALDPLSARLAALVAQAPVMLFMKGSPGDEKCGFSRTICGLLADAGVAFDSFDILTDDDVRQGLKKFSDWPTYPQLYVKGELVGGLDILTEMAADGDLKTQLLDA